MADISLPLFVATPEQPNGRGVVVAHEGLGLTMQILRFSERLAREGYLVVAPDLFFRTGGTRDEDWMTSVRAMTNDEIRDDLRTCIAELRSLGATSIGVTGFCLGGRVAYLSSLWADDLDVDAIVAFYGSFGEDFGELRCPALLLFAGQDPFISANVIATSQARHPDETIVYPDNGHAFMRDGDEEFEPVAAADAWRRLLGFFDEHLGPTAA